VHFAGGFHPASVQAPDPSSSPLRRGKVLLRWVALGVVLICLGWLGAKGLVWVRSMLDAYNASDAVPSLSAGVIALIILYGVLIAIPFMPGIELGVALLVMQGAAIAPFVYLATVTGLMLAYSVGRVVPLKAVQTALAGLGLTRAAAFVETIATRPLEDRLARQRAMLPGFLSKLTVDYRYVTLALLVNVPGTFAIGGGGGILLAAGFSRIFRNCLVLLTIMIATAPVPLAVWFIGTNVLTGG